MTRTDAMRQAQKRWGKRALISAGTVLSSPEKRAEAQAIVAAAKARREAISAEIEQKLQALDWYVALEQERKALYQTIKQHEGYQHYQKFSVGEQQMGCFFVKGRGDTWEEAFAAAPDRKAG